MKSAAVVNVDMGVESVDPTMSMHTKQLAEHWQVETRTLSNWIARVRKLGYEIGSPGERNRTYFNDADQDLIKAARYGTLTENPNSRNSKNVPGSSDKVLNMEDQVRKQQQEAADESQQNRNLELRTGIVQRGGTLLATRTDAAYKEGAAIAKEELKAKLTGYLETREITDPLFEQLIAELDGGVGVGVVKPQLESPDPNVLVAELF